jgi:hypothetical protein
MVDTPGLISMLGQEVYLFKGWDRKAGFLNKKIFTKTAALLHPGAAAGAWKGYRCALFAAGRPHATAATEYKTRIFHTYVVLLFAEPLGAELRIEVGSGLASKVIKGAFKKLLIRFPENPELDGLVTASAGSREKAEALLSGEPVRQGLIDLFRLSPAFCVTDEGIRYMAPGEIIEPARAAELLDRMVVTADLLRGALTGP